jgi:alpha,alpha-trehalose phosphorylase
VKSYVLAALTYLAPDAAANTLRWRHGTLPTAIIRARELGLNVATLPWRTIHGEECSGYWPAGVAAFHINADITDVVLRYVNATGDVQVGRAVVMDLPVQTARLWASLRYFDGSGKFRIDEVTSPDEYSAIADKNVCTNLMAQRNLAPADDAITRHRDLADDLGIAAEEQQTWRRRPSGCSSRMTTN